jgi:hypothetical protein
LGGGALLLAAECDGHNEGASGCGYHKFQPLEAEMTANSKFVSSNDFIDFASLKLKAALARSAFSVICPTELSVDVGYDNTPDTHSVHKKKMLFRAICV